MKTIYKYELGMADSITIETDHVERWLSVDVQRGQPVVWAMVDTDKARQRHTFCIRGTGHPMTGDEHGFLGTVLLDGGALVFHVFFDSTL
jgi:hypothetical protein